MIKIVFNFKCIHTYMLFFKNNLTNYLYFYKKNLCLILNVSVRLHELYASVIN